jgi:hypothetical protein
MIKGYLCIRGLPTQKCPLYNQPTTLHQIDNWGKSMKSLAEIRGESQLCRECTIHLFYGFSRILPCQIAIFTSDLWYFAYVTCVFTLKKIKPWILGKMFESGFLDASGREEGLMSGLTPGLGPVSGYPWPIARARDRITLGGGMVLLFVLRWLLVVLSTSLIT